MTKKQTVRNGYVIQFPEPIPSCPRMRLTKAQKRPLVFMRNACTNLRALWSFVG